MLSGLVRSVARRVRPGLVNHRLTDAPVVQALREASGVEAVVAVYDDGTASAATPAALERELGAVVPPEREIRLPTVPLSTFGRTRPTVRAVALPDADPPVVLLSRRSLEPWSEAVRNFVLCHEFGHLRVEPPDPDAVAESLLPAPDRSALTVRALVAAHAEYRAGEAHAEMLPDLPERYRTPPAVMAEYHAAERAAGESVVLSAAERRALAVRNAAKYLPLAYDPPDADVDEEVRRALAWPLPRYLDWVSEWPPNDEWSA